MSQMVLRYLVVCLKGRAVRRHSIIDASLLAAYGTPDSSRCRLFCSICPGERAGRRKCSLAFGSDDTRLKMETPQQRLWRVHGALAPFAWAEVAR